MVNESMISEKAGYLTWITSFGQDEKPDACKAK